jgi:hypothetical protein
MFDLLKIAFIAAAIHTAAGLAIASRVDCVTHMTYDGAAVCVQWEVR